MSLRIEDIKVKGYERVIHATNETAKLDCIISIHNTKLGPALGGVRSWEYASFEDHIKGSLEPGKLADIVILSDNLIKIDPNKIKDVSVKTTIVGGKIIFTSKE